MPGAPSQIQRDIQMHRKRTCYGLECALVCIHNLLMYVRFVTRGTIFMANNTVLCVRVYLELPAA